MSHWADGHDHHIAAKAAGEAAANVQADSPGKAKGRCSRLCAALLTPRPPGRIPRKPSLPMKPAVSAAALTVYDMAKALEKGMVISGIRLLEKQGGKSGSWIAGEGESG